MSIRDYFAAKAMQELLAAEAHPQSMGCIPMLTEQSDMLAAVAYKLADSLLKAR